MKLNSREQFLKSGQAGELIQGNSYYTQPIGVEKIRERSVQTRSDLTDSQEISWSQDNGRTWSDWTKLDTVFETPQGVRRVGFLPGFIDPINGCYLSVGVEGTLPSDDAMEGITNYFMRYTVSRDGGKTKIVDQQIIQKGDFTPQHPLEPVWVGKNSVFPGDLGCQPIRTREGKILVPTQISPIGPDGEYYNPGGGFTYHESLVLIGEWQEDFTIEWEISELVKNDPDVSTRGAIEPTIAEMPDGRILMVVRGSNDVKPHLPGYRWFTVSEDGGRRWSKLEPWRYTDGEIFHSPSSCSQLLKHSNDRYYWLGNICDENPSGNLPRRPFVIAEVDPVSLMLIKESALVVDDLQPGEDPSLTLSNFMAHEDRETKEIVLHMSRFFDSNLTGNAYIYRIGV